MGHPDYMGKGPIEARAIEELSELQKEICKALRFGWDDSNPFAAAKKTNRERALEEIEDVIRVVTELREHLNRATPPGVCEWRRPDPAYARYYTSCGHVMEARREALERPCQDCGKPICVVEDAGEKGRE